MYMRFRMQIESVMKEVTFWAEPRALKSRAGPRGAGGAGECEAPRGTGVGGDREQGSVGEESCIAALSLEVL